MNQKFIQKLPLFKKFTSVTSQLHKMGSSKLPGFEDSSLNLLYSHQLAPIRWKKASFIKLAGPSIEKMRTKGIH
jgi:hypothetical protein